MQLFVVYLEKYFPWRFLDMVKLGIGLIYIGLATFPCIRSLWLFPMMCGQVRSDRICYIQQLNKNSKINNKFPGGILILF